MFDQRIEQREHGAGILHERRPHRHRRVNANRIFRGWDRGLRRLQRIVQTSATVDFPIARALDAREKAGCGLRDAVRGVDQCV